MTFVLPAPAAPPGPALRDIHLPPAPSWWPPAPGWWMLAGVLLIILLLLARARYRYRQRIKRCQRLHAEVDALVRRYGDADTGALASALHQLLRRAASLLDPDAVSQSAATWRATLARLPMTDAAIDRLMQLDQAIYNPGARFEREPTVAAIKQWLAALTASDAMPRASRGGRGTHEPA